MIEGLKAKLRDPKLIAEYIATCQDERRRLASDRINRRLELEQKLGEVRRDIDRFIGAIGCGEALGGALTAHARVPEAEEAANIAEIATEPEEPEIVALPPAAVARYLAQVEALSAALATDGAMKAGPSAEWFRSLVERVTVHPTPPKAPLDIELRRYLASLVEGPRFAPSGHRSGLEMVAEEGLEPPTRGL